MFREMRRKNQLLSEDVSIDVLMRGTSGVLAVSGDNDYPYSVPLSYVYNEGKIILHCALTGHMLDSIARNEKVSFCVIDKDNVVPAETTTNYRSVIVFGRVRVLDDETEKRSALECFAERYSPDHEQERLELLDKYINYCCVVELNIEHISGKEKN